MSVAFIFISYVLGVLSCVVGLAFGATSSNGDDKLSHALYVERVTDKLTEEQMPECIKDYPSDKVWYVAMKKAVEIVRNGGKEN